MNDFLLNYGLFTAKTLTLFVLIIAGILACLLFIGLMLSAKQRERETIEIENVNERFESLKEALESEILTHDELKHLEKQRKKRDKEKAKANKKHFKTESEPLRSRIFVLRFNGDMEASEVDCLRKEVSTIIMTAKKSDEVLVILESAGGYVHTYGLAASQLLRIRQKGIRLVVSIDLVAASGGYMMASVANHIIAAPFAVVGSIGVLAQLPNFNRLLKKFDIDIEQHTAGEYKTTLTVLGHNTDKAREKFREELEQTHVLFKQHVKENRPILDIDKLATGEHWYGSQALELKLVDQIITSDDYLLEHSERCDIFQVSYVIHETFSQKVSKFMENASLKLMKLILQIPFLQSSLKS